MFCGGGCGGCGGCGYQTDGVTLFFWEIYSANMTQELEQELRKIGLSEKEAKVYLAALEMGPATAQNIAAKAVVNRPTTYVMIESLIKRGLMSSFTKGAKRHFAASEPAQLLYILNNQRREINEKEQVVKGIIERLKSTEATAGHGLSVRVYEGLEGLVASQEDALNSDADEILEVVDLDQIRKYIPSRFPSDLRNRIIKKFKKIRCIVIDDKRVADKLPSKNSQLRYLDRSVYPIGSDVVIYGDKVSFADYSGDISITIIQNRNLVVTMRTLYERLWSAAKDR